MKKYFMGIRWIDEGQPIMHLKDYTSNNDEYVIMPNTFNIQKMKGRICSGAINPLTQKYYPCNELIDEKQTQCYSCMHKYDFYKCVRCHGNECVAKGNEVIAYCNTPHYVYLAYFSKDKIKVGTASEIRRYDRLLEQGAIFSVFIARTPSGKIARQIEKEIIDNGIVGVVNTTFKMKNLIINGSAEDVKKQLLDTYQSVIKDVDVKNKVYLIQPEFNCFDDIQNKIKKNMLSREMQVDMFGNQMCSNNNYEIPKVLDDIIGAFLFAVGKIVALEHNGVVQLYDSKKWEGFLFDFKDVKLDYYCNFCEKY